MMTDMTFEEWSVYCEPRQDSSFGGTVKVCDVCRSTAVDAVVNMTIATGGTVVSRERAGAVSDNRAVWVLDGEIPFHDDENCQSLLIAAARPVGYPPEQIASNQAVEDGFQPCTVCVAPTAAIQASSWELCTGCSELFRAHDWQRIAAIIQSAIQAQLGILSP